MQYLSSRLPPSMLPERRVLVRNRLDSAMYVFACAVPLLVAGAVTRLVLPAPFWDEWTWADLIYKLHVGSLRFADVWQMHNEQRMLFPNVIALGLDELGGWSQLREVLFSVLLIVSTQAGLYIALRRVIAPKHLSKIFLAVTLFLYSFAQIENLDWGFQSAWFLCNACVVASTLLLGTAGQSWVALLLAIVAAVIASFSSVQGLMAWPAGLVTLLFTERRRPLQIVVWIAFAFAAGDAYFHENGAVGAAAFGTSLDHPLGTARFFLAVVGSPMAGWLGAATTVVVGACLITLMAVVACLLVAEYGRNRHLPSRAGTMLGLGVYAIASAAAVSAYGVGTGPQAAISSKFTTIGLYCWIVTLVLSFALWHKSSFRYAPRRFLTAGTIVLACMYAGMQVAGVQLGLNRAHAVRLARLALTSERGANLDALYPEPAAIPHWLDELRTIGDGPFYGS